MKKILVLTIAAFAMAGAAIAQTEAKDSIWAAKEAAKAKKVKDAADLKAFKEKQKADLAAFIEAQKTGKPAMKVEKPAMANAGDSIGYEFGIAQSMGLEQYAAQQFNVEKVNLGQFVEGILDRASVNPDDKEKSAYNSGFQVGGQIVSMAQSFSKDYYSADPDMHISPSIVACGIVAGLLGESEITPDSASRHFQAVITERQALNKEKLYGPNRAAGEKFLEENKVKDGVKTTASGLQYKVLTMGSGEIPTATSKVNVDYEGKLIDGTVFDSSYERGQPTSFKVNQVIKGWTEALQLMPVGSEWELYIPYQLAYGENEAGKTIKPYSVLIFKVKLHGIEQ